jgi:hypothetical protein
MGFGAEDKLELEPLVVRTDMQTLGKPLGPTVNNDVVRPNLSMEHTRNGVSGTVFGSMQRSRKRRIISSLKFSHPGLYL